MLDLRFSVPFCIQIFSGRIWRSGEPSQTNGSQASVGWGLKQSCGTKQPLLWRSCNGRPNHRLTVIMKCGAGKVQHSAKYGDMDRPRSVYASSQKAIECMGRGAVRNDVQATARQNTAFASSDQATHCQLSSHKTTKSSDLPSCWRDR